MAGKSKNEWYADGLRFKCTQCGNCCTGPTGYVWYTPDEAVAMAKSLDLTVKEFEKKYTRRIFGRRSLSENKNEKGEYDCVFLSAPDEQGRRGCTLYEARPQQCRTWPFWPENLKTPEDWEDAAERCPGMTTGMQNKGDFFPVEMIRIVRDSNT